ncbi:MAG TPA: hypothetical protein VMW07_01360 [Gallionella sp.]|nr:hypothetical protein [Gallionella sp.]
MKFFQHRTAWIAAGLVLLMAATRFNHFGTAFALPDASLAVFFLGGLYLAKFPRASVLLLTALLLEAGAVDYYATAVQGISDWCITPAYGFLIPAYASLWFTGRWFARHHTMEGRGLVWLAVSAWGASSLAFVLSNAGFYLFSGRFADMAVTEYVSRVSEYYGSYVSVAMFCIGCAVVAQMMFSILRRDKIQHGSPAA